MFSLDSLDRHRPFSIPSNRLLPWVPELSPRRRGLGESETKSREISLKHWVINDHHIFERSPVPGVHQTSSQVRTVSYLLELVQTSFTDDRTITTIPQRIPTSTSMTPLVEVLQESSSLIKSSRSELPYLSHDTFVGVHRHDIHDDLFRLNTRFLRKPKGDRVNNKVNVKSFYQ